MASAAVCREHSRTVRVTRSGSDQSPRGIETAGRRGNQIATAVVEVGAEISSPRLRQLLGDWQARCHDGRLPARKDFDVLDLKYMMGNLNLLEVLPNPVRFRYRVHCSLAVDRLGLNLTGKTVDAYPERSYAERVQTAFLEVTQSRAPKLDVGYELINDKPIRFEALLLPLSNDGAAVDMIMVGLKIT